MARVSPGSEEAAGPPHGGKLDRGETQVLPAAARLYQRWLNGRERPDGDWLEMRGSYKKPPVPWEEVGDRGRGAERRNMESWGYAGVLLADRWAPFGTAPTGKGDGDG
jgi:hypothetical protein